MSAMPSMATESVQRTDAMCQKATWAREEVQVEIAEQINLSSIKVG